MRTTTEVKAEKNSGYPREYLENHFVYLTFSPVAHGFVAAIDLNRVGYGQFETEPLEVVSAELGRLVNFACQTGGLASLPGYKTLPAELLQFHGLMLDADLESGPCDNFCELLQSAIHVRAVSPTPFFKIAVTVYRADLHWQYCEQPLKMLVHSDDIMVRVPGGTDDYVNRLLQGGVSLDLIFSHVLPLARRRPIILETRFLMQYGRGLPLEETAAYLNRIVSFQNLGARIQAVHLLSGGPAPFSELAGVPLRVLSQIARELREGTQLPVQIL